MVMSRARTGAGQKAAATKGKAELQRAGLMAAWTKRNGKDDERNPYARQNYRIPVETLPPGAVLPMPDPVSDDDARQRVLREIVAREGQGAFRGSLMFAYRSACAVTGCMEPEALEAAHIMPYLGEHTNIVNNGLLLRADIHTLFDKRLLSLEAHGASLVVVVAPSIIDPGYRALHLQPLRAPVDPVCSPNPNAVSQHRALCAW